MTSSKRDNERERLQVFTFLRSNRFLLFPTDDFSNSPREPFFSRLSGNGLLVAMRHITQKVAGFHLSAFKPIAPLSQKFLLRKTFRESFLTPLLDQGRQTVILNVAERNEESLCFNRDSFSYSPHSVISTVADKAVNGKTSDCSI